MAKFYFFVLFAFFLNGCATTVQGAKTNKYASMWKPLESGQAIHLFIFERSIRIKKESVDTVQYALVKELGKMGHKIKGQVEKTKIDNVMPMSIFRGSQPDKLRYSKDEYKELIKKHPGSDIYIFPSVVNRVATLEGKVAKWDGVSIPVDIVGGSDIGEWSGKQKVFSLRLDIFSREGEWLLTSYGGISVPVYADMSSQEFKKKEALFDDRKDFNRLVKGISKAIQPLRISAKK